MNKFEPPDDDLVHRWIRFIITLALAVLTLIEVFTFIMFCCRGAQPGT